MISQSYTLLLVPRMLIQLVINRFTAILGSYKYGYTILSNTVSPKFAYEPAVFSALQLIAHRLKIIIEYKI